MRLSLFWNLHHNRNSKDLSDSKSSKARKMELQGEGTLISFHVCCLVPACCLLNIQYFAEA